MFYVMSDLHGEYQKFLAMLQKIQFSDKDVLFVLGDVVDRGPEPVKLLRDLSMRPNVFPLMGNHELMALDVLRPLLVEITEENYASQITPSVMQALYLWKRNGGNVTLEQFRQLPHEDRLALIEFMEDFEPYTTIETDDHRQFLLVHAGLGNYRKNKKLDEYDLYELTWMRPEIHSDLVYYDPALTVIVGHTPTLILHDRAKILPVGNVRFIDCGAAYGGRLSCLCLDTMQEFYV